MSKSNIPPSRRRSTRIPFADRAYEGLLLKIISGELEPGMRLNIGGLSREMGLSPTPIREALARLEPPGFVRRHDVRGYAVSPLLSADEISSQIDARLLFEPEFAASAANHGTTDFFAQLDETISTMERAGELSDPESLRSSWMADDAFHTLISEQAGNPFILQAFRALGSQLQRFRLSGHAGRTHALEAAAEHRQIADAIREGDATVAADLMRNHIEHARERTLTDAHAVEDTASQELGTG